MTSELCRTCCNETQLPDNLIRLDTIDLLHSITLGSKLNECIPELELNIKKEKMCKSCLNVLTTVYNFRKMCLQTDTIFKNKATEAVISCIKSEPTQISVPMDIVKTEIIESNEVTVHDLTTGEDHCESEVETLQVAQETGIITGDISVGFEITNRQKIHNTVSVSFTTDPSHTEKNRLVQSSDLNLGFQSNISKPVEVENEVRTNQMKVVAVTDVQIVANFLKSNPNLRYKNLTKIAVKLTPMAKSVEKHVLLYRRVSACCICDYFTRVRNRFIQHCNKHVEQQVTDMKDGGKQTSLQSSPTKSKRLSLPSSKLKTNPPHLTLPSKLKPNCAPQSLPPKLKSNPPHLSLPSELKPNPQRQSLPSKLKPNPPCPSVKSKPSPLKLKSARSFSPPILEPVLPRSSSPPKLKPVIEQRPFSPKIKLHLPSLLSSPSKLKLPLQKGNSTSDCLRKSDKKRKADAINKTDPLTMRKRAKMEEQNLGIKVECVDTSVDEMTCRICNISFHSSNIFNLHMLLHSSTNAAKNDHYSKPNFYACEICNKQFKTRTQVYGHRSVHSAKRLKNKKKDNDNISDKKRSKSLSNIDREQHSNIEKKSKTKNFIININNREIPRFKSVISINGSESFGNVKSTIIRQRSKSISERVTPAKMEQVTQNKVNNSSNQAVTINRLQSIHSKDSSVSLNNNKWKSKIDCQSCYVSFTSFEDYNAHSCLRNNEAQKIFKCEICQCHFYGKMIFLEHLKVHIRH